MPELMCEACGTNNHTIHVVDVGGYRMDLCRACAGSLKFPEATDA